jgi:hypothetical protein
VVPERGAPPMKNRVLLAVSWREAVVSCQVRGGVLLLGRKNVLFCKKEPKNFYPLSGAGWISTRQVPKVFLLLFFQKKKNPCLN